MSWDNEMIKAPYNPLQFDASLFDPSLIDAETRSLNAAIIGKINAAADQWSLPVAEVRRLRALGLGAFPAPVYSPRARTITIDGPDRPLILRVIEPRAQDGSAILPRGAFMHIHGGGWTFGTADGQDIRLERLADRLGIAVVSVEYRLSPEHPYPAAPDDCEAAALWFAREGAYIFGTDCLFIGGESAGAHLSVITMLRLRDKHNLKPFRAALLTSGCYDLALTPSACHWGEVKLVLNTQDIKKFVANFIGDANPENPDISPLYADLRDLPPAHLLVGTCDALVDDTLFMHGRWIAAGNEAELAIWRGGAHVFVAFPGSLADKALRRAEEFLARFL